MILKSTLNSKREFLPCVIDKNFKRLYSFNFLQGIDLLKLTEYL